MYRNSAITLHCDSRIILPFSTRLFLSLIFTVTLIFFIIPLSNSSDPQLEKNETQLLDLDSYVKPIGDIVDSFNYTALHDSQYLQECRDFNPSKLMELLALKAALHSTPPLEFHGELREMIKLYAEGGNQLVNDLPSKYNISVEPRVMDPYTITYFRLTLMFPHYYILRPDMGKRYMEEKTCPFSNAMLPKIITDPIFGGLLPTSSYESMSVFRPQLIKVHAYALICNRLNTHIHQIGLELKERIKKSLLSNEHRIRLLIEFNVLTDKNLLDPVIEGQYHSIPEGLKIALNSIVLKM